MIVKTPQQEAILAHIQTNPASLGVDAKAGTGKTTTGIMICNALDGSAFFGAFNKAIATELKTRLTGIENTMIEAGTWHSLGFRGWRRCYSKVVVDGDKLWNIIKDIQPQHLVLEKHGAAARELTSLAKQTLFDGDEDNDKWQELIDHYGVECEFREEAIIAASKEIFKRSQDQCQTVIDFDDMLWAPLMQEIELPEYDTILIDEAQDTNRARRELATRCMTKGGRLIYLGDEHQAIYGFSGADAQAMNLIREKVDASLLPLTVSWRCAQEIIKTAQTWVPDIQWAPTAKQGEILCTTDNAVTQGLSKSIVSPTIPKAGDAVLCRNTKPLVELAFFCIRHRIPATIEGRDIGKRLVKLAEKFKASTLAELHDRLDRYADEECERLIQKQKPQYAASLRDLCDTLLFLIDQLKAEGKKAAREITDVLESMFSDSNGGRGRNTILLSTIHKAKGREWEKVFILGQNKYQPSKYAKQAWQLQQEYNLMYVATTRAKDTLVHIEVCG